MIEMHSVFEAISSPGTKQDNLSQLGSMLVENGHFSAIKQLSNCQLNWTFLS